MSMESNLYMYSLVTMYMDSELVYGIYAYSYLCGMLISNKHIF